MGVLDVVVGDVKGRGGSGGGLVEKGGCVRGRRGRAVVCAGRAKLGRMWPRREGG